MPTSTSPPSTSACSAWPRRSPMTSPSASRSVESRSLPASAGSIAPAASSSTSEAGERYVPADGVLIATGAHPRVIDAAQPDGERIFTWEQIYALQEIPEHMIVVGSGVTGAEFASAYNGLGCHVTLVSSRDRVLPGEDQDAATLIEDVFTRRGMTVLGRSRMERVERRGDGVRVTLDDGRTVDGSHCLLALGSIPSTAESRVGSCRRRSRRPRVHQGRSRLTDVRARHLRRGGLHRRLDAGVGRGPAGPHRDGPPARRRRQSAGPVEGVEQHLHVPRDRDRRAVAVRHCRNPVCMSTWPCFRWRPTRAPRCRASTTGS